METKWVFAIVNASDINEIIALTTEVYLVYGEDAVVLNRQPADPFDMNNYLRASLDNIIVADAVIKGKDNASRTLPFKKDEAESISRMEDAIISVLNKPVIEEKDLIRKIIIKEVKNDSKSDK